MSDDRRKVYEKIWAGRALELERAKLEAPPDKEPFDPEIVARLCSLTSPHLLASKATEEDQARGLRHLEYVYYVRHPEIMTIRELAERQERADLFGYSF